MHRSRLGRLEVASWVVCGTALEKYSFFWDDSEEDALEAKLQDNAQYVLGTRYVHKFDVWLVAKCHWNRSV